MLQTLFWLTTLINGEEFLIHANSMLTASLSTRLMKNLINLDPYCLGMWRFAYVLMSDAIPKSFVEHAISDNYSF